MDRPGNMIQVSYIDENPEFWGWAATTTTLDYDTSFSPLEQEMFQKELHLSNGSVVDIYVTGFQIELSRKVSLISLRQPISYREREV